MRTSTRSGTLRIKMLSYIGAAVALWIAVDLVILLLMGARETQHRDHE